MCEELESIQAQMLANVIAKMRKEAKIKNKKLLQCNKFLNYFLLECRILESSEGYTCLKSKER